MNKTFTVHDTTIYFIFYHIRGRVKKSWQPSFFSSHGRSATKRATLSMLRDMKDKGLYLM